MSPSLISRRALLALLLALPCCGCGAVQALLPSSKRALIALKNRTTTPSPADIDRNVTLSALLAPGHDRSRWSSARAGVIEGYVVHVEEAGIEAANGFSMSRRDTHIEVALRLDAPPRERVILEVTPAFRDRMHQRGIDWSSESLARTLTGRWVRFEGWLMFDEGHDKESENTNPGDRDNWRATAWELHPLTAITIVK